MTKEIGFLIFALLSIFGCGAALSLVRIVIIRWAGAATSPALVGGSIGVGVMLLPCFWIAIFLGVPLGGGFLISVAGNSSMPIGSGLGVTASFFCGGMLGASVGAIIGTMLHRFGFAR
jgi:hypothetical protein